MHLREAMARELDMEPGERESRPPAYTTECWRRQLQVLGGDQIEGFLGGRPS
jgi:hypothetical protein